MNHSCEGHHGDVTTGPHDRRFSKLDFVLGLGDRAFDREDFAMFEEQHGVITVQGVLEQPFGVISG